MAGRPCRGIDREFAAVAAWLLLITASASWSRPAVAAEEVPPDASRSLPRGVVIAAGAKAAAAEAARLPARRVTAAEAGIASALERSLAPAAQQGPMRRLLETRELSFAARRNIADKDAARVTGAELAAVRVRLARGGVIVRAQFSFN